MVEIDRVLRPGEKIPAAFVSARRQQRSIEHFWLCDECALEWTLIFDRELGITLIALKRPAPNAASEAG